jgi:hypothetical protein
VLAMLARDEGVSGPQIAEAMGWALNIVRSFHPGFEKRPDLTVAAGKQAARLGPIDERPRSITLGH